MQQPLFRTAFSFSTEVPALAYLAGLFDGEGYIGLYDAEYLSSGGKRGRPRRGVVVTKSEVRHSYTLRIGVGLTGAPGKRFISYLHKNFGGYASFDLRQSRKENWASLHKWNANGKEAASLLYAMLPFLRIKRLAALVGISFMEAKPTNTDTEGFARWLTLLQWSRAV